MSLNHMENLETLTKDLPDKEGVLRFYARLVKEHPAVSRRLARNRGLLSDILTISAFSPLLATTILQHPEYISWLNRERNIQSVKEKDELLESLARFALTNSMLETGILLARFRRRELIRIYLKDIRGLGTIAEITEEISNLADAVLEYALQLARQELENRHGLALSLDAKGRQTNASFCIVALGKLGSKELNYSSDIDLLFLYSNEGRTTGHGSKGAVTNREYFIKLAELVSRLVGSQAGEGPAYRVDMRLRPHGSVGRLSLSTAEAAKYYRETARMWERQVLIRSRASAGDPTVFDELFSSVEQSVFSTDMSVNEALRNVRRSKEQIDAEKTAVKGFDVKLGRGGIREIEFIAQALQLAYGGRDKWLRSPHTLISLSRLADRALIGEKELTRLYDAYTFLRRLEHRLQMENGLQTHLVSDDLEKRLLISQWMGIDFVADFNDALIRHTKHVSESFVRIFGNDASIHEFEGMVPVTKPDSAVLRNLVDSIEKSDANELDSDIEKLALISRIAPPLSGMLAANPNLVRFLPEKGSPFAKPDLDECFLNPVMNCRGFAQRLSEMRKRWSRLWIEIAAHDVFESIDIDTSREEQTRLAEKCIETAVLVAKEEMESIHKTSFSAFPFAALGLGKLGGGAMDYGSDVDLVLVFDDASPCPHRGLTHSEFYAKAAALFVNSLSSMTRDGSLYRVDLRLRPDGKNGATAIGKNALFTYLSERAAVWEWLAYVKLRGIYGEAGLAEETESESRLRIHKAAASLDPEELRLESVRIRERLAAEKSSRKRSGIDVKYGEGGLQDVYFSIRYLQLRDEIPDDDQNRSTVNSLQRLRDSGSLDLERFMQLLHGYRFLNELDHNMRLVLGRLTSIPPAGSESLRVISSRMKLDSPNDLYEKLTHHRHNVRDAFESVFEL